MEEGTYQGLLKSEVLNKIVNISSLMAIKAVGASCADHMNTLSEEEKGPYCGGGGMNYIFLERSIDMWH